tara:strand:+ start:1374 stop:1520 length:147 start_codon:yes stop_codon:yes gene_type:complete
MKTSQMLNLLALIDLAQKEYYPNGIAASEIQGATTVGQLYDTILEELE